MTPDYRKKEPPAAEDVLVDLNKPLPHAPEAEAGLLGGLMQGMMPIIDCRQALQPAAFYFEKNRIIYEELLSMDEAGLKCDPALVTQRLRDRNVLDKVGGPSEISQLYGAFTFNAQCQFYIDSLLERWKLRRAIHGYALALQTLQNHGADDPSLKVQTTVNTAAQTVQVYTESLTAKAGTSASLSECLNEHMEHMWSLETRLKAGGKALIPTGFPTLDHLAGGIGLDEYWLLSGPTKSGKTVAAACIAKNAAENKFRTKYYSFEVGRKTMAGRVIVGASDKLTGGIERRGMPEKWEQAEYQTAMLKLQRSIGGILHIDNAAGKYVEDLVMDMRMEADMGTRLVVVDLIGKIRTRQRFGNREQELAHISLSIYEATKNYGIAAIVLTQENEEGQARDSRSMMMDCEAWLKIAHVKASTSTPATGKGARKVPMIGAPAEPKAENSNNRRNLIIEVARGFASGDCIPCFFDGPHFKMGELHQGYE